MEYDAPGAKLGFTGSMPTATKPGVMIFQGHSGAGMMQAVEIANKGGVSHMTTVSKRGRPNAPGPAAAFVSAMCERTVHYMAACDQNDEKNVECLMDWAPPVLNQTPMEEYYQASPMMALLESTKSGMEGMSAAEAQGTLTKLLEEKQRITMELRDIKRCLQHKDYEDQKASLSERQLSLKEQESELLLVMADVTKKANAE